MHKKHLLLFFICLLVVFFSFPASAGNKAGNVNLTEVNYDGERYLVEDYERFQSLTEPTVGLSLTGGGAVGLFNIGVIQALEEADISVDILVGTSMGSVVAAMYGSGLQIEQIEEIVTTTPFARMFDLNIADNESILKTAKVNQFIEDIAPNKKLENFMLPTGLLSLDLTSGSKYLTTTGRISEVIQGSYAIPFFFPGHELNGRYFADPGIVENSPAKATRVLGADFIISTALGRELEENNKKYNTPTKAAMRYLDIVQSYNTKTIVSKYSDVAIRPDVSKYGFMDFNAADKLIAAGYQAAKAKIPEIRTALAERDIGLEKVQSRQELDLSQELNDLKYDRLLIDKVDFNPVFYYGEDYSFFSQDLAKMRSSNAHYGFDLDNKNLDLRILTSKGLPEDLKMELRWRKLTERVDLTAKYSGRTNKTSNSDYELGINYFSDHSVIGCGVGQIENKNYTYLDGRFNFELWNRLIEAETDLIFKEDFDSLGVLTSYKNTSKLSNIWTLESNLVFNNTDFVKSPVIYRGTEVNDFVDLQLSFNYVYTYEFVDSIDLFEVLKMSNIGAYLFSDYKNGIDEDIAYGLGIKSEFYLLGLKPFDIEGYYAGEDKFNQSNLGFKLNYRF